MQQRPLTYRVIEGKGDAETQDFMSHGENKRPRENFDVEIRCPVHSRVLSLLRCFAKSVAEEAGFLEEEIDQIEMAVDEACANVIRHAYKHIGVSPDIDEAERLPAPDLAECRESPCVIAMKVSMQDNCLRFQIIDYGIGLNNTAKGVDSMEEYIRRGGRGGLGMFIMRNFMDEVEYEFPDNRGTVVTMTKYLRSAESSAG